MRPAENIENLIKNTNIDTNAKIDEEVLVEVVEAFEKSKAKKTSATEQNLGRIIMKSKITKLAAAAVIIIAVMVGINYIGGLPDGTSVAFGKVIANLRSARTVSFTITIEEEGQEPQTMYCWMLEPNHQRIEMQDGRVVIVDTFQGKSISWDPVQKKAYLIATAIAPKYTLNYYDQVKKDLLGNFPDGSEENIGESEINGQRVVGFRLRHHDCEIIVWASVANSMPVMIESAGVLSRKQDKNQKEQTTSISITDMVIGEELDESLFSLSPPGGYSVEETSEPVIKAQQQVIQLLSARIMLKLARACYKYSKEHDGLWPENLQEAIEYGIEDDTLLNLTDPESELGCVYIRPQKTNPRLVLLYQAYEVWPEGGINVSFVDCHTIIINDEATFKEHLDFTLGQQNGY